MSRTAAHLQRATNVANRRIVIHAGSRLRMYPVLGFPKSGTTWLSQMLADALSLPFARLPVLPVAMPCIVHGHWAYHPKLTNVTFAVRDGRDVMVSFYHHHRLMHDAGRRSRFFATLPATAEPADIRANLPGFIRHVFDHPTGARLNWTDYHERWLDRPGVVYARYERLLADPTAELSRLCREHGADAEDWRIRRAVDGWTMAKVTGRHPGQEDRLSFVRRGIQGEWTEVFSRDACRVFSERAGPMLVRLGYEPSADWRDWQELAPPGPDQ